MVASVLLRTRLLLAAAVFVGTLSAQDLSASSPPRHQSERPASNNLIIHQDVRRVIVDVVVSDSNGKPVSGLTASDFSIAEDGKAQRLRSFDVHDFDSISDDLPKHPVFLPANTFVNVPTSVERGPLYVVLLDLVNMGADDQPAAREQLLKFVRSKPLGTRFAVFVLSDGLYLVQSFTEDRNRLAEAVDPKLSHAHLPRLFLYADNFKPYFSTTRALIKIADFLAELPGHKNIIWISASFPSAIVPNSDPSVEGLSINDEVKEATDTLARGQIAVYPIDVRGVVVNGGTGVDHDLNARHMTEDEIADATGGRAFYNTNDMASALTEATETGAHYYTLMYSPSNQNYNGRLRHIQVELSKRGCHLAYRRTYFGNPAPPGTVRPRMQFASDLEPLQTARPADSLSPNMQHGAPLAHQLLFRAHIRALGPPAKATARQLANLADQPAYFRERRTKHSAKGLHPIQLQSYEIDYTVAARYPALEIAAAAFDAEGKILNAKVQRTAEDSSSIGVKREGIYRLQQQFDVPTTAVSVRLAVRDVATDNVGALEVDLPLASEEQATDAALHPAQASATR
jgi:VWFA-related protein